MTTSRADLLEGVDMEGGENFCDSIYNFLKNQGKDINLFTNSGFGVWSQSDTAKGLATVPYNTGSAGGGDVPDVGDTATGATSTAAGKIISYTITGGGFDTNDAVGVLTLGAVTGTFQTGETINFTDGETAVVGADANIGIKNDPCNNDSTGIWTKDGGLNLAFGATLYTVDTNAVNLDAWITAGATLEAGKIYKIELDINDGVVNTKGIQGYFDDGAAQYGRIKTTGAGFVSVSWTFECATSTAAGKVGFRIVENLGGAGQNIQIRRFSCYEITPCCTAPDNVAFDGWDKADDTMDIYREHWGANARDGSFYSLKVVNSGAGEELAFPTGVHSLGEWYAQFQQRPVTIGAWVKASVANHCRALIQDSAASTYSSYHTGSGDWEWLEVTRVIDASASQVLFKFQFSVAGAVDGSTIVYISQPMAVFGWSIGEGMYQPRTQEIIWFKKSVWSNTLNGSTQGPGGYYDMNIEADSDALIPKGAKAVYANGVFNDGGSFGALDTYFRLRAEALQTYQYSSSMGGIVNDAKKRDSGWQKCNEAGDVQWYANASGAGEMDIAFWWVGVQVK